MEFQELKAALRRQGAARERRRIEGLVRGRLRAYPRSLFREPPPGQHGRTVDACSARAIRTVLRGLLEDLRTEGGW